MIDEKESAEPIVEESGRSAVRNHPKISNVMLWWSVSFSLVMILIFWSFWSTNHVHYLKYTSQPIGEQRLAVEMSYPDDWEIDVQPDNPLSINIGFRLKPHTGIRKWLHQYIYHLQPSDWKSFKLQCTLFTVPVKPVEKMNFDEFRRIYIAKVGPQITRQRGKLSIIKMAHPNGEAYKVEMSYPLFHKTTPLTFQYSNTTLFISNHNDLVFSYSYSAYSSVADRMQSEVNAVFQSARIVEVK